ncbi:hypothetical protein Bca52824_075278 [Brassica carinata]|uniref:Uncharacterized protein n=1 Tax=Brassica carinata TaxID=52824 RepID=A0A8X7PUR2_BRACI|nr:hypothetical protein Bca52824_075278 [Brassica carinata]
MEKLNPQVSLLTAAQPLEPKQMEDVSQQQFDTWFFTSTETVSVVNAIEIVSVVDKLFKDSVAKVGGSEMELGRGMETYVKNSSSVTYALPDGSSLL